MSDHHPRRRRGRAHRRPRALRSAGRARRAPTDHEPATALFVPDDDPLIFYGRIAQLASIKLQSKGLLFFEIHEGKGEEIVKLLASLGFVNIEVKKDMQGKDRMIKAAI